MNLAQSLQYKLGKCVRLTVEKQSVLIKSQQGTFGKTAKLYKSVVRYGMAACEVVYQSINHRLNVDKLLAVNIQ